MKISILILSLFSSILLLAQENQTDNQGRRHGIWKKYYENGKVRYEGRFEHGQEVDTFRFYYDDGRLQAINVFRGKGVAYSKQFGDDKKLAAEGLYKNREKDSVWTYYDLDGNVVSRENYEGGSLNGITRVYFPNGRVAELITYREGKKHGQWKQSYEDGKPKSEGNYVDGKLHGEVKYYHPNGKIMARGNYTRGKMHGTWYFFTENFKLDHQEEWRYGRRIDGPEGENESDDDEEEDSGEKEVK